MLDICELGAANAADLDVLETNNVDGFVLLPELTDQQG
jgi:hypothetical protein